MGILQLLNEGRIGQVARHNLNDKIIRTLGFLLVGTHQSTFLFPFILTFAILIITGLDVGHDGLTDTVDTRLT